MSLVWVNGVNGANISALDRAVAYGDGLFATMRSASDGILYLESHFDRLTQGAQRLNLCSEGKPWAATPALVNLLASIAAQYPHHCIKLVLSRGIGGRGYAPPVDATITEIVSVSPLPSHYAQWQQRGIKLQTSRVSLARQPLLAGMKHLNRLEQVLIKSASLVSGFDDWLVQDTDDNVIESSMANLFLVQGNTCITPALTHSGVAGVMREQVITALLANGIDVQVSPVSRVMLANSSHLFLTNSLFGLVDVVGVDEQPWQPWSYSAKFRQLLSVTL